MQFVGDRLRQRGARVLADFHFAGEYGYLTFFINMNPGVDIIWQALIEAAAARFALAALLRECARGRHDEYEAQAEDLDEITPIKMKVVVRRCEKFVALNINFAA